MDRLQKLLVLIKDQNLTTDSSGRVVKTFVVAVTLASVIQTPIIITAPTTYATTISGVIPEVEQLTTKAVNLSVYEPSPSPSLVKKNLGDCSSTTVDGGSSKQARMSEAVELEATTSFFRLHVVFPSRVPNTPKEFTADVATKDLTLVQNLYAHYMLLAPFLGPNL